MIHLIPLIKRHGGEPKYMVGNPCMVGSPHTWPGQPAGQRWGGQQGGALEPARWAIHCPFTYCSLELKASRWFHIQPNPYDYHYSELLNNPSGLNSNPSGRIFDAKSDKISTFFKKSGSEMTTYYFC